MKVVYTEEALADLDGVLAFIAEHYPGIVNAFERRLRVAALRIGAWPESAQEVAERPGVRALPLLPYPYKLFYRVTADLSKSCTSTTPPVGRPGAPNSSSVGRSPLTPVHAPRTERTRERVMGSIVPSTGHS